MSRWLHAYDDFITKNAHQVSQIESTLRSLTYIIPGTKRDAPSQHCCDSSLATKPLTESLVQAASAMPRSPPSRYTAACSCSRCTTTRCSGGP